MRTHSLVDELERWAAIQPEARLSTFLDSRGREAEYYSYRTFCERTRFLASWLSSQCGVRHGQRILLAYASGLEMIAAFFACVRIGALPVPVPPPTLGSIGASISRLTFIAADCGSELVLTTADLHAVVQARLGRRSPECVGAFENAVFSSLRWRPTDELQGAAREFPDDFNPTLFLQYTSGSTTQPRGVIVSHSNVLHNARATVDHVPITVSWLPQYHDMGLIGYYLHPLIMGGTTYGFAPLDFLRRPALWFEIISRFRATYTSAPNFAFQYCLREDKIPSAQLPSFDLSSLRILMNASEPVRAETYYAFAARFARSGLRTEAHVAAYGLAESTLAVTHYGRRALTVNRSLLQDGQVSLEAPRSGDIDQSTVMSCGRPLDGVDLQIVHPATRQALGDNRLGEIWLRSDSTCSGYWNHAPATKDAFANVLAQERDHARPYLRTGDLGFRNGGELFVCGRRKDLIILQGKKFFPQDIEQAAEAASAKIRSGRVVAFAAGEAEDKLVVVAEVRRAADLPEARAISSAVRERCSIEPHVIIFARAGAIALTSSGKIARAATRRRWLNAAMPVIATVANGSDSDNLRETQVNKRLLRLIDRWSMLDRQCTLTELGLGSLEMVELWDDIRNLAAAAGVDDLAERVDIALLQSLSVAEVEAVVHLLVGPEAPDIGDLKSRLTRASSRHRRQEAECMRSDARLARLSTPRRLDPEQPPSAVLLTGATGFFGAFLLNSLLQQTHCTLHVLVRAANYEAAAARIQAALRQVDSAISLSDPAYGKRVQVHCGDVSQSHLGLSKELWGHLAGCTDCVLHNAAIVNYVLNYHALRPHNVEATRELLRFAATARRKRFHFVSSTFIFGWTPQTLLRESDDNPEMANLDFGYAQSKWVSEQLVHAATRQGLRTCIYRPSLLSASMAGVGNAGDIVVRLLSFMINHGVAVHSENQLSLLPVDIAARTIGAIFTDPRVSGTLHVTATNYYNMGDVTRLITSRYGYTFSYYEIPEFVRQINLRCGRQEPLYPLRDFLTRSHVKISAMQQKRYDNSRYRAACRQVVGALCEPSLEDTVAGLMAFLRSEGLIPRDPRASFEGHAGFDRRELPSQTREGIPLRHQRGRAV